MARRSLKGLVGSVVVSSFAVGAIAQQEPPPPIDSQEIGAPLSVTLTTGEVLRGTFGGISEEKIVIEHPVLGRVLVPRGDLASWAPAPPAAQPAAQPGAPAAEAAPAQPEKPATPPPPPAPTSFFEGWTGSVEVGLNGSDGNTSRFNVRAGFGAERKTELMETKFTFAYTYATEDGDTSEHKGYAELRNDWLLDPESPWRVYALGRVDYDEFQNWDWRVSAFAGIGYEFIETDTTTLIGRLGIGGSREFGGDDNRIHPELNVGLDFAHAFTDTQKFTLTLDYYADLLNISDYRFVGKAAYEILLDPDSGMALKLGVEDRYDSTPDGAKRNDIDYFALLVFKF